MTHNHSKKMIYALSACLLVGAAAGCSKNNQAAQPAPHTNNMVRQQAVNPTPSAIPGDRIEVANQSAQKITQLPGVSSATVLVSRHNAYVAAILKDRSGHLSQDMESQIAQQVKSTDNNIHNVYVSTNPDFVQRANNYVMDVSQGRPVTGFVQEFGEMIKRIFPNAH
ncbi:YhcN/YlaJ family sporulation lipoprotein [Paenibacillus sp. UNC451MF]|uniref:YhcN/YlaJ family sporulation lipoprotein n=1 Tax=Paenibacillus sp. UNC451MF TaxID=1449063 RepID=UPI00068D82EE|nr:YhcN/YlaJ family sporulation lipoprotein [Paenibacillus sp. UNC451MF]